MSMQGNCLCRKVTYSVEGEAGDAVRCYCRSCQASTGSAFAAVSKVDSDKFQITSGQEFISSFESSPGKRRYFCSSCGSAIYSQLDADKSTVRLRLGGIENPQGVNFRCHIFVSEKANWYEITDSLPQFEGWPTMK